MKGETVGKCEGGEVVRGLRMGMGWGDPGNEFPGL